MTERRYLAHGPDHGLLDHLAGVAELARTFAPPSGAGWAYIAGLWHDLGKFRPGFQEYVRLDENAHIEGWGINCNRKSHSAAGALHAISVFAERDARFGKAAGRLVANLIAAHHAGLYDANALDERLFGSGADDSRVEYLEARKACFDVDPAVLQLPQDLEPIEAIRAVPGIADEPLAQSIWLRLIFSALVDADFLDTEQYLDRQRSARRSGFPLLANYLEKLDAYLDQLGAHVAHQGRAEQPVMRARLSVLNDCRRAAALPTGIFSLQVPTGGGKTLASLAFALRHAVANRCERVIVAIPYTSIVEQTANVFAEVFGRDNIVEHHSQADSPEREETARSRLACENWDAPLIVTTNVQLFESLFAARTSRCRKLHRVQRSVIVLDEAQTLPPEFLQPTLDALRWLVKYTGTTVVSCTATQPVLTDIVRFDPRRSLRGLAPDGASPTEIVSNVVPLYEQLERVRYRWPANLVAPVELRDLAARVSEQDCALVIANTRRDAEDLVGLLRSVAPQDDKLLCLSTNLCGQHRAEVINEIRACLQARSAGQAIPLRVVSTQLVEAGVDLDFPRVFRALAGLDSVAQAAGRCNREGLLGPRGGEVEVFVRPVPAALTAIARAVQATISVLADSRPESLTPQMFQMYFERWYAQFSPDHAEIRRLLRKSPDYSLSLRTAAASYRLIDDADRVSVIVPPEAWQGAYVSSPTESVNGETQRLTVAMAALRNGQPDRWHLRALQRRIVQMRRELAARWLEAGELSEPCPGWFVLENPLRYDSMFGLRASDAPYAPADLVG